ncbi:hypothetical protein [Mesorhizobium sanjuanii]|uniref:hypothetical protein n=1 Tax=Mesorhizobium sanjuanii TaxID=2037900 RepID=UPI0013FD854D|nr:hypothetical protein [Mesorhizobium sanjuanii]
MDEPARSNAPAECAVSVKNCRKDDSLVDARNRYEQALVKPDTDCPLSRSRRTALPSPMLAQFTAALGVSGDVLADDDPLEHDWSQIPYLLN